MLYPDFNINEQHDDDRVIIKISTAVRYLAPNKIWFRQYVEDKQYVDRRSYEQVRPSLRESMIRNMMRICFNIQLNGVPQPYEAADKLQVDEATRLELKRSIENNELFNLLV